MNIDDCSVKTIEVGNFDRIALQVTNVENEVFIAGGERAALTIEARPDVLAKIRAEVRDGQLQIQMGGSWSDKLGAALATSLTRPHIKYVLTAPRLTDLDIIGLVHAKVDNIKAERLHVKFEGVGSLSIAGLNAGRLDIDVPRPGPCVIEVDGRVEEQRVSLSGMSDYRASGLESRKAAVAIKGPGGHATVRVADEMEAAIHGPGSIEYYGNPRVTNKVSPLGVVRHLSDAK